MEHIKNISSLLDQTGLSERPGSLLYSGNETIRKGSYYFLGTNPGGHKDQITNSSMNILKVSGLIVKLNFQNYLVNIFIREILKNSFKI